MPNIPQALDYSDTTPISLHEGDFPIDPKLEPLFPTLMGKGMKYVELRSDEENGKLAKSDKPLRVSIIKNCSLTFFYRSVAY